MTSTRTTPLLPTAYRPLFAHVRFRRLLPAVSASDLGDGMSVVAVAWLAIVIAPPGRSGLLLGAAVAAYSLPGAVGALVFGRWLRRLHGRQVLMADSWLRAVLLGCVPVAWAAGVLHPIPYIALLAGSSLLHAWGSAGKYTLRAEMLPADQRLAANALVSSSSSASVIIGPALAGLLATAISPAWIVGLDAVSFAILALQVGRLRGATGEGAIEAPVNATRSFAGLRLLRGQPELLGILVLTWLFFLLYGPVEVALPLHVTEDLRGQASLLGLYWALFGIGAVVGALGAGALRKLPLWPTTLGIVAGWGAILVPFGLQVPTLVSLACFALGGVIYGPFTALSFTLFQNRTPAAWLTTVLAARSAALLTASPVGTALGGPLTAAFGPGHVLAGSGVATILLAATAAIMWVRTRRPGRPTG